MNGKTEHNDYPYGADTQNAALMTDVRNVLDLRAQIVSHTRGAIDDSRIAGVVTAAAGYESYLPYTVPLVIEQVRNTGRSADIVLGLNNGYECPEVIAGFLALPDTEIIHLYTGEKPGEAVPSEIFDNPQLQGPTYRIPPAGRQHRIFVVHQRPGPYSAGKVRMLGDILHSLFLPSIAGGWALPVYTLLFDAESIFVDGTEDRDITPELARVSRLLREHSGDAHEVVGALVQDHFSSHGMWHAPTLGGEGNDTVQLPTHGLEALITELESHPELDIIGAITRFCVYNREQVVDGQSIRLPVLSADISPMHLIYNYTCGLLEGGMCMPGAGTVGKSDILLSLLAVALRAHPEIYGEDAITTVLAEHAGFCLRLSDQVFVTNRCPGIADMTNETPPRLAWPQQFITWYGGFNAIEKLYGRANAASVLGPGVQGFVTASLAIFSKTLRSTNDLPRSLALLQSFLGCREVYEGIIQAVQSKPHALKGADGRPTF
ncbi:MAG TPA: hypothetical protein VEX13_07110 [Chloroflexia bacterium]|nr:hypothetical protein [Chloroflexia bacterium]